jgi:hypothetical protein
MPRGSREQVLYWTSAPRFLPELLKLAEPVDCRVTARSVWMPMGLANSREARLETFGPRALPAHDWDAFAAWWLPTPKRGNTPNWDIALNCDVGGRPGLILVEAKAHERELDERGKSSADDASSDSRANHEQIMRALEDAQKAIAGSGCLPGVSISHQKSYQLANRIAFAWKLASMGIPTVLIYLGFIDDKEISNAGTPFKDDSHWHRIFRGHLGISGDDEDLTIECTGSTASFWVLSRCRPAQSSPKSP